MIELERLRSFLIRSLRLEDHSPEEQNEILSKLKDLVEAQIDNAVVGMLQESDMEEAEKLKRAGDDQAFYDFLHRKIPNLPFVLETVSMKTLRDFGIEFEQE